MDMQGNCTAASSNTLSNEESFKKTRAFELLFIFTQTSKNPLTILKASWEICFHLMARESSEPSLC